MKKYIKPMMKVAGLPATHALLAGSLPIHDEQGSGTQLGKETNVYDADPIEHKSVWDD